MKKKYENHLLCSVDNDLYALRGQVIDDRASIGNRRKRRKTLPMIYLKFFQTRNFPTAVHTLNK